MQQAPFEYEEYPFGNQTILNLLFQEMYFDVLHFHVQNDAIPQLPFQCFLATHDYHFVKLVAFHHLYYLHVTLFEKCHIPVCCFVETLKESLRQGRFEFGV